MNKKEVEISERLFHKKYAQLGPQEKRVAHHLAERTHIARNVAHDHSEKMTFGQKLADQVAAFGGSWNELIALQHDQLKLLTQVMKEHKKTS